MSSVPFTVQVGGIWPERWTKHSVLRSLWPRPRLRQSRQRISSNWEVPAAWISPLSCLTLMLRLFRAALLNALLYLLWKLKSLSSQTSASFPLLSCPLSFFSLEHKGFVSALSIVPKITERDTAGCVGGGGGFLRVFWFPPASMLVDGTG